MTEATKPAHLSASLLELLPTDISRCLHGMSSSLSRLIGQIKTAPLMGKEELEGFSGITRKVNYQRLLTSEWGLLHYLPAEFQRRAAMGEHLFLDQQRTASHKASKILALFNTGPEQLGNARVIHLALWLLMLRRSEVAKSEFHWGILQEGADTLSTRTDQHVLMSLLKGRSASYLTSDHLQQWHETIEACDWAECWMIGVDECNLTLPNISGIKIREPWAAVIDHLDIEVLHQQQIRRLSLELPDPKLMLRMLRNPFEESKAVDLQASADTFIFAGTGGHGRRAIYRQVQNNRLKIIPLPSSTNSKPGKSKFLSWDKGQELVAVNVTKRRLSAITQDKDHWYLHRFPNISNKKGLPKNQHIALNNEVDNLNMFQFLTETDGNKSICLVDTKNQLRELHWQEDTPLWKTKRSNVIVHFQAANVSFLINWEQAKTKVNVEWDLNNQRYSKSFNTLLGRMPRAFGHASGNWHSNDVGVIAIEYDHEHWQLHGDGKVTDTPVDSSFEVLGVIACGSEVLGVIASGFVTEVEGSHNYPLTPQLVLLNAQRNQVFLKSGADEYLIHTSDVTIVKAYQCQAQLNLHIITETNEHRIYSFVQKEIIYRHAVGGEV